MLERPDAPGSEWNLRVLPVSGGCVAMLHPMLRPDTHTPRKSYCPIFCPTVKARHETGLS